MNWEVSWEGVENSLDTTESKYYTSVIFDFVQGVLWQQCFRGTVEEFIQEQGLTELKTLCHKELILKEAIRKPLPRTRPNAFQDIQIGIGTYGWKYGADVIEKALEKGCKFVDTSPMYGFGRVEKSLSNLDLSDTILGTKIPKHLMTRANINKSFHRTQLLFLNTNASIHYQLHWPNKKFGISRPLFAMEYLRDMGDVKSIGVCNCSVSLIAQILALVSDVDTVQVPFSPFNTHAYDYLIPFCKQNGIRVIAYSPFGQNLRVKLKAEPKKLLSLLAKNNECTVPQLILAWIMALDLIPIPRTNSVQHMEENMEATQISISEEDLEELNYTLIKN